ncbi:uncharacterized protein LOC123452716 [Hordeum vulgare subsp. vulgare]|uniref:uncharacterized protein LOC123452716 n=1 Tax=Hordeum vulgare subsp. vulgare TaxID=112509 RepID=UPI001D1A3817|nr:uncharacterized protein LOC123452716 [Hordeum vulgare subsp. vulgare]
MPCAVDGRGVQGVLSNCEWFEGEPPRKHHNDVVAGSSSLHPSVEEWRCEQARTQRSSTGVVKLPLPRDPHLRMAKRLGSRRRRQLPQKMKL